MPEWQIYLLLMIVYAHISVAGSRMYNNISVCMIISPWWHWYVGIDDSSTEVYTGINTFRWIRNQNVVMVKTPGKSTDLEKMENYLPGGLCCKETLWSRPGGRRKTLWWFRGLRRKKQKTKTKGAQLTHKMMESLGGYLNNIAAAAT